MEDPTDRMMSAEESLRIIDKILYQTRVRLSDSKFAFLFWGYFIALLSLIHFLLAFLDIPNGWLIWTATPLGWIAMFAYYRNRTGSGPVNTRIGKMFTSLWAVLGVNLLLIGFFGHHILGDAFLGVLLLGLSWGALASGIIIQFRPLIIGAVIANLIAILALAAIPFQFHLLLCALICICCNIIPGHMLNEPSPN